MRNLVMVLGDQLNLDSSALEDFDPRLDRVLMVEATGEAVHVWSHKARIALFLSGMRHFARELRARRYPLSYRELPASPAPDAAASDTLGAHVAAEIRARQPQRVIVCEPGEYRVLRMLQDTCVELGVALEVREDRHFISMREEFARWAGDSSSLSMEFFYRHMRRKTGVLMRDEVPVGGVWNFDRENRRSFGKHGPTKVPEPPRFEPDAITRAVIRLITERFPDHPGSLECFGWPVTRGQALAALEAFIRDRLPQFGQHQDVMWAGEPHLWHSLLSAPLNLKLLHPREVVEAAERALQQHSLPMPGVEGFIRQILGWREFMRGVYWLDMPELGRANHFGHRRTLPRWYWSAQTHMSCLRHALEQTLEYGYAHHIQRLMLTGNFALLAQIAPQQVCDWYLAIYVDAVEWVELPNTAGMALYANGGRFTSKPYAASGAYVARMSNYCDDCRYRPGDRSGAQACPMTVLYWNFLMEHERELATSPRTALMAKNLARFDASNRLSIRRDAERMLDALDEI